jgi:hypothetical protein
MVRGELHEIQFWEERQDFPIITEGAKRVYNWLIDEFENRSEKGLLPAGMPPAFTGIEVRTKKTGKMGSILFTADTSLAKGIEEMPCIVRIEYQDGFAMVGMPERHTLRQLAHEFGKMIPDWGICPRARYQRDASGTVVHEGTKNWNPDDISFDFMLEPLPRIQEDNGRGTEIKLRMDQLGVLDYWAQAEQEASVGVPFHFNGRMVEY